MKFENVFIPYGCYWSTPFVKWQGKLADQHSLKFLASSAKMALADKQIDLADLDALHLGTTIPQAASFWGAPWVAAMMGAPEITGPTISQACATSARTIASAASEIETESATAVLACAGDRTSNGPHLYYPDPHGAGGRGFAEDWVWDNFNNDPYARVAMVETAENTAHSHQITRADQDELALRRYEQYQQALDNDRAFQKRYMLSPLELPGLTRKSPAITILSDEGVPQTTREGLAALKPVKENGTVTYGTQTHPADGNAGLLVASRDKARALTGQSTAPEVQLLSFAQARAPKAHMGQAPVPAAIAALAAIDLDMSQIKVVKTHNPFVVNDLYFSRELNFPTEAMNNYGSSLIFGHPQGPTGLRLIIEMIEELEILGGGYGLFTGCAAGDSAAAVIVKVD